MEVFKFNLKDEVKDIITGFSGVIIARIEWLNGCVRYVVQTRKRSPDGKIIEDTIDEQQLVYLHPPKFIKEKKNKSGGPMPKVSSFSNVALKR